MMHAKARKAHLWLVLDMLGRQGIPFIVFLVMARVIGPDQYGQFAIAMAFVGVLNVVVYRGIADGLFREQDLSERHTSTAFWMNIGVASLIFILIQLLAGLVARLYQVPNLEVLLRTLALLVPLQALVSVQTTLFQRNLDTAVLALRTFVGRSIGGVVGIAFALAGAAIWSLVALQLVQALVTVWVLWRADPWRPRLIFDIAVARTLTRFGSRFMGGSLVTSLGTSVDSLIVGFIFDPVAVGFYVLAARIIEMAYFVVLVPLRMLIMPLLSNLTGSAAFAGSYDVVVRSAVILWMLVLLALGTGSALMPVVFGEKWTGSIAVLQAMSLSAFSMPLWAFVGETLSAAGRPDLYIRFAAIHVFVVAVCVSVGSQFGLVAAGLGWAAACACMVPIGFMLLRRVCAVNWRAQMAVAVKIGSAGLCSVAFSTVVHQLVTTFAWPAWVGLSAGTCVGLLIYAALLEFLVVPGCIASGLRSLKSLTTPQIYETKSDVPA